MLLFFETRIGFAGCIPELFSQTNEGSVSALSLSWLKSVNGRPSKICPLVPTQGAHRIPGKREVGTHTLHNEVLKSFFWFGGVQLFLCMAQGVT